VNGVAIDKKAQPLRSLLAFSSTMEGVCSAQVQAQNKRGRVSEIDIRLYQQGDADQMHAAALESVTEVYPWMAWCHEHYSLHEARRWVALQEELAKQGAVYEFAILGEGSRFLGGCGINQISTANRFANPGYWVRSSAMGRGVAPAAVRLITDYAFRETDLIRLEIVCAALN